ncbi:hypothetical protein A9320_28420 [Ruegeria sp. PBVC088]|nr:hypothetical protein A9320_28420 [Ruegeria sp. PBVC088]
MGGIHQKGGAGVFARVGPDLQLADAPAQDGIQKELAIEGYNNEAIYTYAESSDFRRLGRGLCGQEAERHGRGSGKRADNAGHGNPLVRQIRGKHSKSLPARLEKMR